MRKVADKIGRENKTTHIFFLNCAFMR